MDGISTMTQKGQVAIPKGIRDYFSLKASDKVHFSVQNGKIIGQPVPKIRNMRGFIKSKRALSKEEMKKIIRESVVGKYANRS